MRHSLDSLGFRNLNFLSWNACAGQLYERAVIRREGLAANGGALVVSTGSHTGRSPNDKFIVRDDTTENTIWWSNNKAMTPQHFAALKADFLAHAVGKDLFVQDLFGGAEEARRLPV